MTFDEFREKIMERIGDTTENVTEIGTITTRKNNGKIRNGICIQKNGMRTVVYLDEYYECFLKGMDIETIFSLIQWQYDTRIKQDRPLLNQLAENYYRYDAVKENIIFALVNTEKNMEWLLHAVHMECLDLSVVFKVVVKIPEGGYLISTVSHDTMEKWGVTLEELVFQSLQNMHTQFEKMELVIKQLVQSKFGECYFQSMIDEFLSKYVSPPMYVLSTNWKIWSAGAILCPGALKKCADMLNSDLVIIPSSVHETLILPYDKSVNLEEMASLVRYVNENEVSEEEQLSDYIYLYRSFLYNSNIGNSKKEG